MNHILMVNHHTGIVGGGELSMLQLMQGIGDAGYRTTLITTGYGELAERATTLGIDVQYLPMPSIGLSSIKACKAWLQYLRDQGGSILHAQTPRAAFYAGLAGRIAGLKSIFHCRVASPDRLLDAILVRLTHMVICNSHATARRFAPWPKLHLKVIHNGLDMKPASLMADHKETQTLLFVGRMSKEKQPDVAWQVFAALADRFSALHLVFVGGDDEHNTGLANDLRSAIRCSPWSGRVEWAGAQPDVAPWYALADIVVMPSRYEGFGRVLVEAMAHQVPVVAFRVGGIPEVVEHGIQGILVDADDVQSMTDAVAELLDDEDRRLSMGRAGKDRARMFTLARHVTLVMQAYQALIEGKAEGHGGS